MRLLRHVGFTLIELLVVIAIIAMLGSLLLPIINSATRGAKKTNTQNLCRRVEGALGGFKADAGHFPWQEAGSAGNELGYRLHHELTVDERAKLDADLQSVNAAYCAGGAQCFTQDKVDQPRNFYRRDRPYMALGKTWEWDSVGANIALKPQFEATATDSCDLASSTRNRIQFAICLNRMGIERASVAVFSGNTAVKGVAANNLRPWVWGSQIVSVPRSRGFSSDYLGGDVLDKEFDHDASGTPAAIKDMWGNPLQFIHSNVNGIAVGYVYQMTEVGSGRGDKYQLNAEWFNLAPQTRAQTTLMASDITTSASPACVANYELWSSGPDGQFNKMRDQAVNKDNISSTDYNRGLK